MNIRSSSAVSILFSLIFLSACEDMGDPVSPPVAPAPTPIITTVVPDSGAVGDTVTITGSNFGATQSTSTVNFGNANATSIISWSATSIIVRVPIGASDSVSVTVSNKTSARKKFKVIVPLSAPVISLITPDSARAGDTVTITGSNFGSSQGTGSVTFGSTNATVIVLWSNTQIRAAVPTGIAAGTTTVIVTANNQTSNAASFKVLAPLVSFANDIRPLINQYGCANCHGSSGGFSVATHASIVTRVTPGNGDGSLLVRKLRGTASGSRMPANGPPFMSNTEIQKFVDWINQGALNN